MQEAPARVLVDEVSAARLVGLLMECPVSGGNPADCPLHEIRLLPLADKFKWARSRTREEADAIFTRHANCPRQG